LSDQAERVNLIVVLAGRETQQLGPQVSKPWCALPHIEAEHRYLLGLLQEGETTSSVLPRFERPVAKQLVQSTQPEGSAQAKCSMARWDVGC